jgi:outer membrane murein-binding lipoprotein Lpp
MIASPKDYRLAASILMGIVGLAMLAWVIPYGIANYKLDRCSQDLQIKVDALKSETAKTQSAIDAAKKALQGK